jgi:tetratricopeptide (TPR) repeat protein
MGSIEDARALRGEAAKILQTIDDRDGLAVLKWEEATALLKMGMYEEAELQYKCAQQLFASLKNKTSMALCANARGEVARQRGELTTAVEHYSKFRDVMDGLNNAHGLGLAETNIGWCLIAAGRTRLAIEHFSRGRETLLNNAPPAAVVGAMLGLCWAMILLRDSGFGVVLREASALMKGQAELVDEDALEALSVVRGFVEAQGDAGLLEALRGFGA